MAVVIGQIITETVLSSTGEREPATASGNPDDPQLEVIVRRASERVLETLRREWDR